MYDRQRQRTRQHQYVRPRGGQVARRPNRLRTNVIMSVLRSPTVLAGLAAAAAPAIRSAYNRVTAPSRSRSRAVAVSSKSGPVTKRSRGSGLALVQRKNSKYCRHGNRIIGRTGPFFKLKRGPSVPKYLIDGFSRTNQKGGEHADTRCVYVGHGPAHDELIVMVVYAMVRKILIKAGIDLRHPDQQISTNAPATSVNIGEMYFMYKADAEAITNESTKHQIPDEATLDTLTTSMYNIFRVLFNSRGASVEQLVFRKYAYTGTSGSNFAVAAQVMLDLTQMMIDLSWTSKLVLQNRTIASSGATSGTNLGTDVERNPVVGRSYTVPGNHFHVRAPPFTAELPASQLQVAPNHGTCVFNRTDAGIPAVLQDELRHPPSRNFFKNCFMSSGVSLQPGQIRTSYLRHRKVMSMQKFTSMLHLGLIYSNTNDSAECYFGKSTMFAFSKLCDSRVADESAITIGYEVTQTYSARVWNYKTGIARGYLEFA